jgi:hypothetical protein
LCYFSTFDENTNADIKSCHRKHNFVFVFFSANRIINKYIGFPEIQNYFKCIDAHRGPGGGGEGGYKLSSPNLLIKMQKNTKKVYPPQKIFTTPIYPPSQSLAKTSWTLPLDFQTACNQMEMVTRSKFK